MKKKLFEIAEENRKQLFTISDLAKVLKCTANNLYLKINKGMKTERIAGQLYSSIELHEEYLKTSRRQGRPKKNESVR